MHFVFFDFIDAHGLECPRTDVQGYFCGYRAFVFQTAQKFFRKMQAAVGAATAP